MRLLQRAMHLGFLLLRPMTLGARVAAFDEAGRVCLVRHTYMQGWYLPGGGMDPGEAAVDAARRELREEANVEVDGPLQLVSVHFNRRASRRDHVLLFRADAAYQTAPRWGDMEIAEAGFFPPAALPEGTTPATRERLAEILEGRAPSLHW